MNFLKQLKTGAIGLVASLVCQIQAANFNFVVEIVGDFTPPTMAITWPNSRLTVHTSAFTLRGWAADNESRVTAWYQLNNGEWKPANGASNWTATVMLAPGPNIVQVYARDSWGNVSATNTVTLDYEIEVPITIHNIGPGMVVGAASGQFRGIGSRLTLLAKPVKGCVLTNWLVSVDGVTVLSTNRATPFIMQSNLVLTASFADVTPPDNRIISPQSVTPVATNGLVTVQVQSTDNMGVSSVDFSLNGADFGQGFHWDTNLWVMDFALLPGTNNIVKVVATDASGNSSKTNTIRFVYTNRQTNGNAITFAEHCLAEVVPGPPELHGISLALDTSVLNAVLIVPGLRDLPAETWSNLFVTLSFGTFSFAHSLSEADLLGTNTALFYCPATNEWDASVSGFRQLALSRAGSNLMVTLKTGNPTFLAPDTMIAGDSWTSGYGLTPTSQPLVLSIRDGDTHDTYLDLSRNLYFQATLASRFFNQAGYWADRYEITGAADYAAPTLGLTAPLNGQRWSNAVFTVKGTARDNVQVSNVWVQVNSSGWLPATTTNRWTNWTALVTLKPGTNTISAFAKDTSANVSATVTRSLMGVFSVASAGAATIDTIAPAASISRQLPSAPSIRLARPPGSNAASQLCFYLSGQSGQTVIVEASTNLITWTPIQTNSLNGTPVYFPTMPPGQAASSRFYRLRTP